MDTLAKETLGLPIFICPTDNRIMTSATHNANQHQDQDQYKSTSPTCLYSSSSVNSAVYNSNNITSSTTPPPEPFFATAKSTRSPTSTSFPAISKRPSVDRSTSSTNASSTNTSHTDTSPTNPRRNTYTHTYTPPTYSPRRESLLSTKRLSQVYDFAAGAIEEAWRKAEIMLGEEEENRAEVWREDLESGDVGGRVDGVKREKGHGGGYGRFGEEGGWDGWLD